MGNELVVSSSEDSNARGAGWFVGGDGFPGGAREGKVNAVVLSRNLTIQISCHESFLRDIINGKKVGLQGS